MFVARHVMHALLPNLDSVRISEEDDTEEDARPEYM